VIGKERKDLAISIFSSELEQVLRRCGWSPERRVPVRRWTEVLIQEGFVPIDRALLILESFGGLTITPPIPLDKTLFLPQPFTFDPILAATGEYDRVADWQERFNVRVFPLAAIGQGGMILFADDGRIIDAWADNFNVLGQDLQEALEVLVFARAYPKRFSQLAAPNWWEPEE
jgi:hypothetical protein